ncbi:MAG: methyltransferase family protein [bacterium]
MTDVPMKEKNGEHPFGDTGQVIALGSFLVVWVGDSFFLRASTFLSDVVPLAVRLALSAPVIILGMSLAVSGHKVAGPKHDPAGVVTTGAFRYVRHPLYLGCILFYLGLCIATASLFSLAVLTAIIFFYNYIAGYEERLLDVRYGEGYRRYKEETGRWLPRIGRSDQPGRNDW